jgi:uroporphyrinogen-III decarboxylase
LSKRRYAKESNRSQPNDCIIAQADHIEALERQLAEALPLLGLCGSGLMAAASFAGEEDKPEMAALFLSNADKVVAMIEKISTAAPSAGQAKGNHGH